MQGLGQAAEDPLRVKGTLKKGASRLKKFFLAANSKFPFLPPFSFCSWLM